MAVYAQPPSGGTYRIKLYQTPNLESCWKYIPRNNRNPGWVQLDTAPSTDTGVAIQFKWSITPVPRQADTFKILPLYKDTSLNAAIGMTKNDAFYNPDREFQYLSQIVGLDGVSGNWKIVRDPSGQFSRIHFESTNDVLACYDYNRQTRARFPKAVHFVQRENTAFDQRWVFESLDPVKPPTRPPTPPGPGPGPGPQKIRDSSYESLFFRLTPEKAAEEQYDVIIIGTGIGGGIIAGDLFDTNSRLGKNAKSVLVIEKGGLPFHSHCLNASRPTGFDEDRGQQNDTFFALFRDDYKFAHEQKDWRGGPVYGLGGRSSVWGLFSPRVHDEILTNQFAPGTQLASDLIRVWYRRAERLMGLSIPSTTPTHQNLMERLNAKNNFRNTRNVRWQWGRIASEFREDKNFDFARGAYSTIDKLLEIAMSKRRHKDGTLDEHPNWKILLRSEVRSIIWDKDDFYQAAGVVIRGEKGVETTIRLKTDNHTGKVLRSANIILAAGSVQSPTILLRSGKKNFLESNGGLHLTDHDIFAKAYTFRYLNPSDREKVGSMKIQTHVQVGDDPANGDVALANFSIDADSFLPRSFMPNTVRRNDNFPKFIAAYIRTAPLNRKNTIQLDNDGEPVVTMNRDPPFKNSHKHVAELRALTREAVQVVQNALGVEMRGIEDDKDDEFFKPLELGGVSHELGTIPMQGVKGIPYCVDANLKLRGHKGVYVCDLSVFPYSPAANPTLTLAALALRLSRTTILPCNPVTVQDDDTVYVMNQTGERIEVVVSNVANVPVQDPTKEGRQRMEPGDIIARKRKHDVVESVMVYTLDFNSNDTFVPEPNLHVAHPGQVLAIA